MGGGGSGKNLGAPLYQSELNINAGIFYGGLASQPEIVPQKPFGLSFGTQRFHAAPDLNNTFMADSAAETGSGHLDGEFVGVVENRSPALQVAAFAIVRNRRHAQGPVSQALR